MQDLDIKVENIEWLSNAVWTGGAIDTNSTCPECGSEALMIQGHCKTCYDCGWSLCGV